MKDQKQNPVQKKILKAGSGTIYDNIPSIETKLMLEFVRCQSPSDRFSRSGFDIDNADRETIVALFVSEADYAVKFVDGVGTVFTGNCDCCKDAMDALYGKVLPYESKEKMEKSLRVNQTGKKAPYVAEKTVKVIEVA